MFATDMSSGALFLQPTFVGPFTPLRKPVWRDPLWALPQRAAVDGAFLFAADGSLAGVAIVDADGHALVPADTLLAAASELADRNGTTCADIGITVQALTPALQAAIGTAAALGVAWVNPDGPAASQLTVGDALDRVNDQPVRSIQEWQSMMDRIAPGDPVRMQLLRGGTRVDVTVTSVAGRPAAHEHPLGLATRRVSGSGVEILRVEAGSAGERAGLRAGDILTRIGNTSSPTPRDVAREFATSGEGPLVAAVTRGNAHLLVALEKTW
jgi:S1-C subfamily serine protease